MIPHRWIVCVWIALFCVLWLPLWLTAKSAVEVTEVKYGNLPHIESFIGSLYFKETSSIASSSDGIVKNIFFNIGQKVKKGQKLLSVDSDLLLQDITIKQSKITDAQYTLERQKNELERYKSLLQSQSISIQQYENLQYEFKSQEARITALKAELEISKTMLKHKTIYAPFDGIIVDQKSTSVNGCKSDKLFVRSLTPKIQKSSSIHQAQSLKISNPIKKFHFLLTPKHTMA